MKRSRSSVRRVVFVLSILTIAGHAFAQERTTASSSDRPQEKNISAEAGRHFIAAQTAEARLDLETAAREYEAAIEIEPRWAEAMINLGIVYNRQGNADKAIAAFTRAAQTDPRLLGAQLNLAITYFRAQRFREADISLRRAVEIDPTNNQARGLLVLVLFALEQYGEVVDRAEKLVAETHYDAAIIEVLGRAYLKLRRYDDAVRTLELRAGFKPVSAEIYFLLGETRDNAGDSEGAIREFNRAIATGEKSPDELHFALGYVLWKLRRYEEAEVAFRNELKRDPNHARSIYYLGNIALSRGDCKTALRLLEQASAAMPQDFAARYDLGKALLQVKEPARALDELRAAIAINPKHSGAHYQLAVAYRQLKREEEAQKELTLSRELNKAEREDLDRKVQGEERKKPDR